MHLTEIVSLFQGSGQPSALQEVLGTNLNFCTVYHPQSNEKIERINQTLEDLLRACVLDFKSQWDKDLPRCEFAYSNSFHSFIGMAPYYGRRYKTPICWEEVRGCSFHRHSIVVEYAEKVKLIQERLKTTQSRRESYGDNRRRDLEFQVGDKVLHPVPS